MEPVHTLFRGVGGGGETVVANRLWKQGGGGALTTNGDQRLKGEDQINLVVVQPKSSKPLFPPSPAT